jgi:hypothetical protein
VSIVGGQVDFRRDVGVELDFVETGDFFFIVHILVME